MKTKNKATVEDIRSLIEETTGAKTNVLRMERTVRIYIRRMMSCYWENSSTFSIDLVGAVIRQGSFVEKMNSIDWVHSPAVKSTMERLIAKYLRYFHILAKHPTKIAVPTLDVDLAWRTSLIP